MAQLYASVAIGTAAAVVAIYLLLLRAEIGGRRIALAFTRQWVATGARTSGLVVALLSIIAVSAFALVPAFEPNPASVASDATSAQGTARVEQETDSDPALAALRAYAGKIDGRPQATVAMTPVADTAELPDVGTMIAMLVARLEQQPDDVGGWKMLGWSYSNTGRPEEASKAYRRALELDPGDVEAQKALAEANGAQTTASKEQSVSRSDWSVPLPAGESARVATRSKGHDSGMIRGMVDRLAARLETSPNDENGWLRLVRSRMVLGEKDAAGAALGKALEAFAGDASARARLTAAARELGIKIAQK
jgi:cytochrome c-type biogenesis protein CcmH